MGRVEERIKELGYEIPECPTPVAAYVVAAPAVEGLLFVSGQTAVVDGKEKYIGVVGKEISVEEAYDAARIAALRLIAEVKAVIGDLDRGRTHCKGKRICKCGSWIWPAAEGYQRGIGII